MSAGDRPAALFLPLGYTLATRIASRPLLLGQMAQLEWVPAIGILIVVAGFPPGLALGSFLVTYMAFITVYEVGYIANDLLAYREGNSGRRRLGEAPPGRAVVMAATAFRGLLFVGITVGANLWDRPVWWAFYGALFVTFFLHNMITDPLPKLGTFTGLALLRFLAPVFIFLSGPGIALVTSAVMLNYVIYRLLNYLASKDLLKAPQREEPAFKIRLYCTLLIPNLLLSVLMDSAVPAVLCLYYLLGWIALGTVEAWRERRGELAARW